MSDQIEREQQIEEESLTKNSLQIQKAAWIREELEKRRAQEDQLLQQILREQQMLQELDEDMDQNMAHAKEGRRYREDMKARVDDRVYEMHDLSADKREGMREYGYAYRRGYALAMVFFSLALCVFAGYLHGIASQTCLVLMFFTGVQAAILVHKKQCPKFWQFVCDVFSALIFPGMLILFIACVLLVSFGKPLGIPDWNDVYTFFGISADMEADFSVSFINVGSADCTLIKCGDKSVLIDGGTNLVTDKITAYLKRSSVTHLDAVIVSHPDSDHIGSLPDIIDEFGTDVVYFGKYSDNHKTPEYEKLVNSIEENNIKTVIPVSDKPFEIGNMTFKFYQPEKDFGNTNDNSLVTMLEYDEKRFLFTGDISSKREESMVNSDKELKCDVLKVAHHGSKYSSSEDFLAKASPETAVISVSADDTALPDYYITALLNSVCKNVYRTDSDKTIMITVENGEICTKTHA